jgi:LPS-assembly protein
MPQRYAMLVVALVAAADALAQGGAAGGAMPALPGLAQPGGIAAGEEPMTIDAERMEGVGALEMSARGAAEIDQGELNIFGETLRLNQELGTVEGDGGVRLKSGVDRFFGPRLRYNMLDDTGLFEQPQFLLQRGLPAHGSGESMEFLGKQKYRFKNARFTTCEPGNDDWLIEAKELTLDYVAEEGEAQSPRLRFFDVPILGAPFVSFPLENRRKSGLRVGHSLLLEHRARIRRHDHAVVHDQARCVLEE